LFWKKKKDPKKTPILLGYLSLRWIFSYCFGLLIF